MERGGGVGFRNGWWFCSCISCLTSKQTSTSFQLLRGDPSSTTMGSYVVTEVYQGGFNRLGTLPTVASVSLLLLYR